MSLMKKIIIFGLIILGAILIVLYICFRNSKPDNIYKKTYEECNGVGLGYKGMCYGNLAVKKNDISICEKNIADDFDKKKCIEEFNNSKK
ncbi:MAG: hypothetical protein WAV73_04435 [Candidatus Moraniibacteriota bacterium]